MGYCRVPDFPSSLGLCTLDLSTALASKRQQEFAWWWANNRNAGRVWKHEIPSVSSNSLSCQYYKEKSKTHHTELAITLVPQFPKTGKPGCELAAPK